MKVRIIRNSTAVRRGRLDRLCCTAARAASETLNVCFNAFFSSGISVVAHPATDAAIWNHSEYIFRNIKGIMEVIQEVI